MKTAALITHSHPPAATEAVAVAVAVAREAGWRLVGTRDELAKHGAAAEGIEVAERPAAPATSAWCSAATARSCTRCAASPAPACRSSASTSAPSASSPRSSATRRRRGCAALSPARSRRSTCPGSRSTLDGATGIGLNDVTLTRRPHDRVAELSYRIAGEEVGHVRCDGLVAATPVGSTGYNLANQGPILAWGVKGYAVSYISPHSLTARALVVAPGDVLHVGNAEGREPVEVAVDGAQLGRPRRPARRWRSASSRASAASPSCPEPASTSGFARSSATWRSRAVEPRRRFSRVSPTMERKWWTLVLISIATFMLLLDVTVVNVALPDIQRELHASLSSLQWVVDAYSLTLAAFLLTAGSLGDRLGRRRVFTIGFGIFTFASFLCGIAGDPTLLNLARGLQGVGGAGMFATSLALIGQEFHGKDRATAFGVWGATSAAPSRSGRWSAG